jgi:hypothetical protein
LFLDHVCILNLYVINMFMWPSINTHANHLQC